MKFLSFSLVLFIFIFSCKKEERKSNTQTETYYFKGTITNTSSGNSVVGYKLKLQSCNHLSVDSLISRNYCLKLIRLTGMPKGINCLASAQIEVLDTNNNFVTFINIPYSDWVEFKTPPWGKMDTAYVDLTF